MYGRNVGHGGKVEEGKGEDWMKEVDEEKKKAMRAEGGVTDEV